MSRWPGGWPGAWVGDWQGEVASDGFANLSFFAQGASTVTLGLVADSDATFADMALVTAGQGSLVATLEPRDEVKAGGKPKPTFEQAEQEWTARRRWTQAARELLDEAQEAPQTPVEAAKPDRAVVVPIRPVVAPVVAVGSLAWLLSFEHTYTPQLLDAMALRDVRAIAEAAMRAEALLHEEEEEFLTFLIMAEAA
jgi:hypothetical protein